MPETVALRQKSGGAGVWLARNWALLFLLLEAATFTAAGTHF